MGVFRIDIATFLIQNKHVLLFTMKYGKTAVGATALGIRYTCTDASLLA